MKTLFSCGGLNRGNATRSVLLAVSALACYLHPATLAAATISYVQGNSATPQSPQTTVKVAFTAAQAAGDLNVIVVGWNDTTASVSAVTDTVGNVYTLAAGPTSITGFLSQSIYYAKNIASAAAGANSVTVTFSTAAAYPDIRILEYSGADLNNPVDATAASTGTSTTSSSGSATTTNATDLLFGANIVATLTTGAGSGFTKRLLTAPDGDIAEDRMVTATGSYSATAPVSPSGRWIMQMVAFRTPTGVVTPPTVSSLSPNSGSTAGGTAVTITGTNFATGATVTFGGAAATNVAVVNSATITATTPAGSAGAVTVTVTVSGQSGSLSAGFTYVVIPTVTSVSPNGGPTAGGTPVTITGTNFATGATVAFGAAAATNVVVVSGTQITATTPAGSAGAVTVTVTVNGQSGSLTNGFSYVLQPTVSSVSPTSGSTTGGTAVTISGTNFVTGATVTFGAAAATSVVVVSGTQITATTPAGSAGAVTVTVRVSGQSGSLSAGFTYVVTPTVTSVSPNGGPTTGGTPVTITGTNFATGATVAFGAAAATNVVVASGTQITATTPSGSAGAVTVTVTVNGQSGSLTNGFSYALPPTVSSVSPTSGSTAGGTLVTITGTNFATGATVTFGAAAATNVVVVSGTQITATTPAGSAGVVTVTVTNPGVQSGSLANGFTYVVATTVISYVQGSSATPQTPQTSVSVTFTAAQGAGDLNVVVVGWNDATATVSAVADKSGNTYTLAVGPTVSGSLSQSIYYAKNIVGAAAGANIVTVTFSAAATYPDLRILEYSGADPNSPVDVAGASSGNSANSSSGSATTTTPTDLVFGANIVATLTTGPGSGFTQRLLTSPDGDIAEDEMVTATGSHSATAPVNPSGLWIMQMVAFRTSSAVTTPLVSLSSASINFGNQATGGTSNPQPATLTNVGAAQLAINSIVVSGGNAGDFAESNNCGTGLAPNVACTINVTFTPSTTGARSSAVTITDNAPGSPQTIALSGTGTGFLVSPRVTALTFTRTQQFTASSGGATWSVDGVGGGSASLGTITATGLYTPPASVGTHTVTATTSTQSASATVYVTNYPGTFTYHNDNLRTGQNLSETVLTLSNVNQSQFGKLFSYPLDGIAFASPLYVANVSIPGQGYHNVVYVETENDSVYAFDADGLSTTPLWHVSFLKSGVTPVPCADTGECGDIPTQIGITSTPVIDQTSGTIYIVAATKEGSSTWVQRLHALDITTGAEKFGGPVVLQASVPGTGSGSSGGNVAFDPLRENQRPGLLLNNGVVYLAFGSHGDNSPWHGWVLGYNATTLQQTMYYNATPNGNGGGIWQGGGGLATDTTGDIYFVTSNGDFDVNTGGTDYGDSVEKLSPSGTVVDYFAPYDQQVLSNNNLDLGAGGPVMLVDQSTGPYPHLLITAGKDGTIYVINRDNLGHYNASNNNQIVQSLPGILPNGNYEMGNFSTPVFFNGYVYFGAISDNLKAFQLTNGQLSTAPTSQSAEIYGARGASVAVSANGASNGILWALQNNGTSPDNDVGSPGILYAYNANNLSTELYNSSQVGSRDTLDNAAKFSIPLVANGKVFIAGQTQLTAFGLLP